jgi:DNA ligase (NAD+)
VVGWAEIVGVAREDCPVNDVLSITDPASYADAVEMALQASAAYYGEGTSTLDDAVYDGLLRKITAYEDAHPDQVRPDSPSGKVAGGAVVGDVPHTRPMLSLDNVFGAEELLAWAAGVEKRIGRPVGAWCVEPKFDGLAIAARYRGGRLTQIITRGDGGAGEDVSHAIGTIVGLPQRLDRAVDVEVRGEVVMTAAQFEAANQARTGHGGAAFSNPRSAAAGSLRAFTRSYKVEMTFFAYGALSLDESEFAASLAGLDHSALMRVVDDLGVATTYATGSADAVGLLVTDDLARVQERVEEIAAARAGLPFGIDGIVIKTDAEADQETAGFGTRAPRWAIAYKLPADEVFTRLVEVQWATGRTGIIAPRGVLEPVQVAGSVVTYATLHNPAIIAGLGIMIGDQVAVRKAGDVIPRIEAPVVAARTGDETPIVFPQVCPNCGSEIDRSQERWKCVRGRACNAVASIVYAVGRGQLDIAHIAETRIRQLVDTEVITDFADLFTLTRDQLLALDRMGEVSADNLLAALDTARRQPLSRVFCALGVLGTGRTMSRRIAQHFATMDAIQTATVEEMMQVEGIGPEKAPIIVTELAELADLIARLKAAGVNMTEPGATGPTAAVSPDAGAEQEDGGKPLAGMTVVVTGTFPVKFFCAELSSLGAGVLSPQ